MLTTGFILAGISVMGCYLVYRKFPAWMRAFMNKHPLFTDLTAAITTYVLFAGTVTGLIAAAWAGIIVSLMLTLANNPTTHSLMERCLDHLTRMKTIVLSWIDKNISKNEDQPKLEIIK